MEEFNRATSKRDAMTLTIRGSTSEWNGFLTLALNVRYDGTEKTVHSCFHLKNGRKADGEDVFGKDYRVYLADFIEKSGAGGEVSEKCLAPKKANFNDFYLEPDGGATFFIYDPSSDASVPGLQIRADAATLAGLRYSTREIDPAKPMVALTFDDGPHNVYGSRILDCLEKCEAVATFYEIASNVEQYPEVDRRAVALGCEVGAHSYGHKTLKSLSAEELADDMAKSEAAFVNAIGYVPATIRPPQGEIVKSVMNKYDQVFVGWSVDTEDWISRDPDAIFERLKNAGDLNGQVVLMHSIYEESAAAAELIVPWLLEQGYQLVTVSELFTHHYGITPKLHCYYQYDYFASGGEFDVDAY